MKNRIPVVAFLSLVLGLALAGLAFGQTANQKMSQEDRTRNDLMQLERDLVVKFTGSGSCRKKAPEFG